MQGYFQDQCVMSKLQFREACPQDATIVLQIVNDAYRTEGGWTTESHLVVGDRLVKEDYLENLSDAEKIMLIANADKADVACILLSKEGDYVHFSMLAVLPDLQDNGYASQLLDFAESLAKQKFNVSHAVIHVLDVRQELLDFYDRRGYIKADEYLPFPLGLNVGKPIGQNLMLEVLTKVL